MQGKAWSNPPEKDIFQDEGGSLILKLIQHFLRFCYPTGFSPRVKDCSQESKQGRGWGQC
jgi:hypothetical protein